MQFQDYIIEHKNILSKDICDKIIEKFDSDERKTNGVVGAGVQSDRKISIDLNISAFEDWKDIDTIFYEALSTPLVDYSQFMLKNGHEIFLEDIVDSGYQIQRTDVGGKYDWHNDSAWAPSFDIDESEYPLNQNMRYSIKLKRRYATYIFYLNDSSEFEGGSTKFKFGDDDEIVSIKPEAGKLLLFPAFPSYCHCGEPVTSGKKYLATGWASDFIRDYIYT